jgi:hypothetical protein
VYVDTSPVTPSGATISVSAGADLQRALDTARPGDVITLPAGAVFPGSFVLREKQGQGWITVRSSAPDGVLPSPGRRIDPSHAPLMPKLVSSSGPVVSTESGAHHYRLIGLEMRPAPGAHLHDLVRLGDGESREEMLPHHIVLDRCYLRGDPARGGRRGIALNGRYLAVIDSYLADFKQAGDESQGIAGWNGSGPFKIVNNHVEGAGENLLFGGADPAIRDLVPSDIEIRSNHFVKPLAWKAGEPGFQGVVWSVKNIFELKNARRVLVEGNLFEHNWAESQSGFAILFTIRNQDGSAPWSVVEDVSFANNVLRHTDSGINILARDDIHRSDQAKRILIRNNLFEDVGSSRWGGGGRLFQILRDADSVVIEHNTAFQEGNLITVDGEPTRGFIYRNNIAPNAGYGVVGRGTAPGVPTLQTFFPASEFRRNVIVGASASSHPPDNFYPRSFGEVGFRDINRGDYRLADSSPYRRAGTDGADIGVDFDALLTALGPLADQVRGGR